MNQTIMLARLVSAPEIRVCANERQTTMATFRLACPRRYKSENGADADFYDCTAFGKVAETIEKYLTKGSQALWNGRIEQRSYTDKEGNKRYTYSYVIESFDFVGSAKSNSNAESTAEPKKNDEGFMNVPDNAEESGLPFN